MTAASRIIIAGFCFCVLLLNAIVIAQQQLHFSQSLYSAVLNETGTDLAGGQHPQPPPGFLHVHCLEPNTSSLITYSIATTEVSNPGPFIVNTSTGELSITADLDYEAQTTYTFTVDCSSSTGMNASARVEIYLLPINEFRPYVTLEGNIIKLYEDEPSIGKILVSPIPGKGRLFLNASDQDAGKDGVLRFYLENNNISESLSFLTINHTSGEVTITTQPDADTQGSLTGFHVFAFSVVACDFSHECYTSNSIIMFLFAADDNPPMFSRHNYSVSILEDDISTVGMIVSNLSCTDGDVGPGQLDHIEFVNATAQVIRHFIIPDPKKGVVFLNQTLDYELIQSIQFTLQCFDTANNSDIATVLVIVKPVNDNRPIFNVPRYFFNISCTTASIQHPIGTVKATDKDIDNGNNLTYFIQYNPYYSVTQDGDIFLRSSVQNVPEFLSLSVNVSDGKFSDSARVFIFFTCKKQQGPYFIPGQKVVTIDESISVNTPVLKVKCNYSEAVPISYSFSSGNTGGIFRVNSTSGIISVANPIPLSDEPYRHYSLEVQCTVNYGTTHLSDSMVIVILIQNATALVSSIPFIIAIVVAAAIIILMAVSGIFIAITKAFRQKRRVSATNRESVVPLRMMLQSHSGRYPQRRTVLHYNTAYRMNPTFVMSENRTSASYEIVPERPVSDPTYESLPGSPNLERKDSLGNPSAKARARTETLMEVDNPAYIPSQKDAHHPKLPSATSKVVHGPGLQLPTSESGYFDSMQSNLDEESAQAERPSSGADGSRPACASCPSTSDYYLIPVSQQQRSHQVEHASSPECSSVGKGKSLENAEGSSVEVVPPSMD